MKFVLKFVVDFAEEISEIWCLEVFLEIFLIVKSD